MTEPLSPEDAAVLRMLAGANFLGGSSLTLPSGRVLNSDEAQALTAAYSPARGEEPREKPTPRREWEWYRDRGREWERGRERPRPPRPTRPAPTGRSPLDLYLAGGGNPGNAGAMALMYEASRGYERRQHPRAEWHRNDTPYHQAPIPRRWHACWPWSVFIGHDGIPAEPVLVERCACGGKRTNGEFTWEDRNSRRKREGSGR